MAITSQQIQNVKLGACNVSFSDNDLGLTKGGVSVSISTQNKAIQVDQFGQTVVNDYILGRSGTVKVPMAETDITKLANAIPGAFVTVDRLNPTKMSLTIPTAVGTSLFEMAGALVLHPTANAATDLSEDVTVPLASPTGSITFDFQAENERVFSVEFTMYPDPTSGLLCYVGDPSANSSQPSSGSPPSSGSSDDSDGQLFDPTGQNLAAIDTLF